MTYPRNDMIEATKPDPWGLRDHRPGDPIGAMPRIAARAFDRDVVLPPDSSRRSCGESLAIIEREARLQHAARQAFAPTLAQRDADDRLRMEAIWARDEQEQAQC